MGIFTGIKKVIKGMNVKKTIDAAGDAIGGTLDRTSYKEQGTRRHKADMLSDNWLSKSIRPAVVVWLLLLMTFALVGHSFGLKVNFALMEKIGVMLIMAIGFYFPGRSVEKYIKNKAKNL